VLSESSLEVWLSVLRHWFAKSTCKNPFWKDGVGEPSYPRGFVC